MTVRSALPQENMTDQRDRIIGCIVGGAIGDWWGVPYENRVGPLDPAPPKASHLSDDTQLTLATCEAISESSSLDPESIGRSFARWFKAGRITGLGSSTLKALRDLALGAPWTISGATGEMSAGNGAAMRIAPVAFLCDPRATSGRQALRDICRITHRSDEAYIGALAVVLAIVEPGWDFLCALPGALPDSRCRDKLALLAQQGSDCDVTSLGLKFGVSGHVADSVPMALLAASLTPRYGFAKTLQSLIACGGDTDTMASIAGQVAGSKLGIAGIPAPLVDVLPDRVELISIATAFATAVEQMVARQRATT